MKPTVGRIVHYHPTHDKKAPRVTQNGPLAAIITEVPIDYDGGVTLLVYDTRYAWHEDECTRTVLHNIQEVETTVPGHWSWPPRESGPGPIPPAPENGSKGIPELPSVAPVWQSSATRLLTIDYTNHRGERAIRKIRPLRMEYRPSEWHGEHPQWLLIAVDPDRGQETREFSLAGIHGFPGA